MALFKYFIYSKTVQIYIVLWLTHEQLDADLAFIIENAIQSKFKEPAKMAFGNWQKSANSCHRYVGQMLALALVTLWYIGSHGAIV